MTILLGFLGGLGIGFCLGYFSDLGRGLVRRQPETLRCPAGELFSNPRGCKCGWHSDGPPNEDP
jgi:hypothetical protein